MEYQQTNELLAEHRRKIAALRAKMRELQRNVAPMPVDDYTFASTAGPVRLSELFGGQRYLFMIHNMGKGCDYCTIWADGFNGVLPQLQSRAAFVLSSPDDPDVQSAFKAARGWNFTMISHRDSSFAADMGYAPQGGWLPGLSVFRKDGDVLVRVSDSEFDVGDEFCVVWPLFDMLPEELGDWNPVPLRAVRSPSAAPGRLSLQD